jgi:hypothetical protein
MASIITATTTSGLTQSADNSGVLQLASGAGNLVTVPSTTGTMALTTTGLTQADSWATTTGFSQPGGNTETQITNNWARMSDTTPIGSGMTQSSGVFTFPATGQYFIYSYIGCNATSVSSRYIAHYIQVTTNNSSYNTPFATYSSLWNGNAVYANVTNTFIFNVTSTSLCKVRFTITTESALTVNGVYAQFIRLGNPT